MRLHKALFLEPLDTTEAPTSSEENGGYKTSNFYKIVTYDGIKTVVANKEATEEWLVGNFEQVPPMKPTLEEIFKGWTAEDEKSKEILMIRLLPLIGNVNYFEISPPSTFKTTFFYNSLFDGHFLVNVPSESKLIMNYKNGTRGLIFTSRRLVLDEVEKTQPPTWFIKNLHIMVNGLWGRDIVIQKWLNIVLLGNDIPEWFSYSLRTRFYILHFNHKVNLQMRIPRTKMFSWIKWLQLNKGNNDSGNQKFKPVNDTKREKEKVKELNRVWNTLENL